jgi:hypothetical protein
VLLILSTKQKHPPLSSPPLPKIGILLSLTTSGDSLPSSGLAVDRMPIANEDGYYHYERTFTISEAMAENIEDVSIVVHGIDIVRQSLLAFLFFQTTWRLVCCVIDCI